MERDPLLDQTGGRPPNINSKSAANSNNINSKSKSQSNVKDSSIKKHSFRNSQLDKKFFEAVFQEPSPSQNEFNQRNANNNIEILKDVEMPNIEMNNNGVSLMNEDGVSISSIDDEFKLVQNRKRKFKGDVEINLSKCQFKKSDNSGNSFNRQNKFSVLGDINIEPVPLVNNCNLDNNSSRVNLKAQTNVKTRNTFCPPIFLENINIRSLIEQLNTKNVEFKIKNQSRNRSKLYFKNYSAHSEMMQLLREREIPSYTYTPKEYKRQGVLCRGLFYKTDVDEIKSYIERMVPNTVDTVSKFTTDYSRKHSFDTGLFLVTLKPGRKINELTSLKCILNQIVSWEKPKSHSKVPQCWRCQQWGHFSKNCTRPFSCMKCEEKHLPGQCTLVRADDILPFCVNCKEKGHTSNYRGCPAYKKYISLRKKPEQSAKLRKISASNNVAKAVCFSNAVNASKSFASLFRTQDEVPLRERPKSSALIQEFMKIAQLLCGPEPMSLEDKISNFMKNYRNMTEDQARNECLSLVKEVKTKYGP